jgi:hypothetical protein
MLLEVTVNAEPSNIKRLRVILMMGMHQASSIYGYRRTMALLAPLPHKDPRPNRLHDLGLRVDLFRPIPKAMRKEVIVLPVPKP